MSYRVPRRWLGLALGLALLGEHAAAQGEYEQGAVGLGLALRHLPVAARVLSITAHPDDENNAVLVALSRGRGAATAVLTLTRGEGGQNAIGPERGEALGVLRTGELLAAHRFDGVEQFFGSTYEFGFSFSLEETLARWGHQDSLGDVVRVLRAFRPDVVLALPPDAPDHQHHVAAARLAVEAFRAAADPSRFPEQLSEDLRPWQARTLWAGGVGGFGGPPAGSAAVTLDAGAYDPLLGMTWSELGSLARTQHRCQAARQLKAFPGDFGEARYALLDAVPPLAEAPRDLFDGLGSGLGDWRRLASPRASEVLEAGLPRLAAAIARALEVYDARAPQRCLGPLAEALAALRELADRVQAVAPREAGGFDLLHRLDAKEREIVAALALAQGFTFEATADDGDLTPGQTVAVTVRAWNPGPEPLRIEALDVRAPEGWRVEAGDVARGFPASVEARHGLTATFRVTVPPTAAPTQPYWRRAGGGDRYRILRPLDQTLPFSPPDLLAGLRFAVAGVAERIERSVVFRYEGRQGGEKRKAVGVVPALSVRLMPETAVFPLAARPARREVRATLHNHAREGGEARVRLELPQGWTAEPADAVVRFRAEDEEAVVRFEVTAPAVAAEGVQTIGAVAVREGREFREAEQTIAYDHVEERRLYRPAESRALTLDVRTADGVRVGYVMGVGDDVPEAVRQLGLPVTLLGPEDLAEGDLARFTSIVLGVRAYQARQDLRAHQARLMRWVEAGGHLLVQYQRGEFNPAPDAPSPYAPYPARVGTRRVTDETAPIRLLAPVGTVLLQPNRLGARDWDGWVQERALQLLDTTDPRFRDLLASEDPFPLNAGEKRGLLVEANVGRGTWTYVGLALFRQLPAGVPGSYRLLANLLSRPRGR